MRGSLLLVLVLVLATACAGADADTTPPPERTTVYFLVDGGRAVLGARRDIEPRPPRARQALEALLAGPTDEERDEGLDSALPEGTVVRSLTIAPSLSRASGTATVDLGGVGRFRGIDVHKAATQIARTLIGLSGIERVRLRADGKPWPFYSMTGEVIDRPIDYDTLLGWWRIGGAGRHSFSAVP